MHLPASAQLPLLSKLRSSHLSLLLPLCIHLSPHSDSVPSLSLSSILALPCPLFLFTPCPFRAHFTSIHRSEFKSLFIPPTNMFNRQRSRLAAASSRAPARELTVPAMPRAGSTLANYEFRQMTLPIADIHVTEETSREVDESHVDVLFQKMVLEGFQTSSVGSVTVVGLAHESDETRFYIADGLHRRGALVRAKAEGVERLASIVDSVPVQEAFRPDGQAMTMEDVLYLSQRLNELVHTVLPTTIRDRIHAIISIYNCNLKYAKEGERKLSSMTASQLCNWFFQRHFSGILRKSTVTSIVNVALNMRRSPRTYEAYKMASGRKENEVGISLLVLKDTAFTKAEDRASELMVRCIHYRSVKLLQSFGRIPGLQLRVYLNYIRDFYLVIREVAPKVGMTTDELADLEDLEPDGTDMIPTWKSVFKRMVQYEEEPVPKQEKNHERRREDFRTVILQRFNIAPDRETPSPRPGASGDAVLATAASQGAKDVGKESEKAAESVPAPAPVASATPPKSPSQVTRQARSPTQFGENIMEPLPVPLPSQPLPEDEINPMDISPPDSQAKPDSTARAPSC